jgi:hypothetical protein
LAAILTGIVIGILRGIEVLLQPWPYYWLATTSLENPRYYPEGYTLYYLQRILVENAVGVLLQWLMLTLFVVVLARVVFPRQTVQATQLFKVSGFALIPLTAAPTIDLLIRNAYGYSVTVSFLAFTANVLVVFYVIALWILMIRVTYDFAHGEEFVVALPIILYYLVSLMPTSPQIMPVPLGLPGTETIFRPAGGPADLGSNFLVAPEFALFIVVLAASFAILGYFSKRPRRTGLPPRTTDTAHDSRV